MPDQTRNAGQRSIGASFEFVQNRRSMRIVPGFSNLSLCHLSRPQGLFEGLLQWGEWQLAVLSGIENRTQCVGHRYTTHHLSFAFRDVGKVKPKDRRDCCSPAE